MKHTEWNVRSESGQVLAPHINAKAKRDTVFFDADMSADDVKRSLVNHDGYCDDIIVRRAPRVKGES